jgi:hypothetical protein
MDPLAVFIPIEPLCNVIREFSKWDWIDDVIKCLDEHHQSAINEMDWHLVDGRFVLHLHHIRDGTWTCSKFDKKYDWHPCSLPESIPPWNHDILKLWKEQSRWVNRVQFKLCFGDPSVSVRDSGV